MAACGGPGAAEYGRRAGCFRDHRRRPFCFSHHVPSIRATGLETAPDGLVEQPGLSVCSIRQPTIRLDSPVDQRGELLNHLCSSPDPPRAPSLLPQWDALRELLVPLGELDLGSVPDMDIQELFRDILSKQCFHLSATWLPLSPVSADRDEGLAFPPTSSKLRLLLLRELELERIDPSQPLDFGDGEASAPLAVAYCSSTPDTSMRMVWSSSPGRIAGSPSPKKPYRNYREVITPPLSPVSDAASPFIPEPGIAVIDLTSEPGSPTASQAQQGQSNLGQARIDSDIVAPSSTVRSSPPRFTAEPDTSHSAVDLRLDVLLLTSSDPPGETDLFRDVNLCGDIHDFELPAPENHFEDMFATLLRDRQQYATNLAEQERLNPADSISRISVPVLDFHIQQPAWLHQTWTARQHLSWLQSNQLATFRIPVLPKDARLDSSLGWMPVPRASGNVQVVDRLELDAGSRDGYLAEDGPHPSGSARFISTPNTLAVLDLKDDEGIDETDMELSSTDGLAECSAAAIANKQAEGSLPTTRDGDLQSGSRPRRKALDDDDALLPRSTDTSATSKLLSGFMELRAVKRPRLCPSNTERDTTSWPSDGDRLPLAPEPQPDMVPAPVLQMTIPEDKGPCIISLALERAVIRQLEKSWPAHMMVDRDYSQHDTTASSKGAMSPLALEADVSLTPSTGIIVTTLVKVKQKPLPGSKAQAPLRERVEMISQKYEALVILVSESNPEGEVVGNLSSSDRAAYADFVRFTAALDADVATYLVHGANETLSKWILSLMCRCSKQSAALKGLVSSEETKWELFLRRAGLNVMAAQVLSKTLFDEFGNAGLEQFLAMPTRQRVSIYGQLVGGQRVLLQCCEVLDQNWA